MSRPDRLREILEVLEASLGEPELNGEDIASRAYLSRYHFARLSRGLLGEAPGAFRRRLLLERAAYRLTATADPVIEIALDAGYQAPEAFSRAFSQAFGCAPSQFRRGCHLSRELAAPSGIHFHPPAGIRIPAAERSTSMDVLIAMLEHHMSLTGEILDRLDRVREEVLDRPIELSVEGIDREPTLRSVCGRLVSQLEMWSSALQGESELTADPETSPSALRRRWAAAVPAFRRLAVEPLREERAGETFVDLTCSPPQTFTYGGVIAHVLTYSAVRRTMAIGALETAGVTDLGAGDPMAFVGGSGDDASTIQRSR